jgi:hypothetical protein
VILLFVEKRVSICFFLAQHATDFRGESLDGGHKDF